MGGPLTVTAVVILALLGLVGMSPSKNNKLFWPAAICSLFAFAGVFTICVQFLIAVEEGAFTPTTAGQFAVSLLCVIATLMCVTSTRAFAAMLWYAASVLGIGLILASLGAWATGLVLVLVECLLLTGGLILSLEYWGVVRQSLFARQRVSGSLVAVGLASVGIFAVLNTESFPMPADSTNLLPIMTTFVLAGLGIFGLITRSHEGLQLLSWLILTHALFLFATSLSLSGMLSAADLVLVGIFLLLLIAGWIANTLWGLQPTPVTQPMGHHGSR